MLDDYLIAESLIQSRLREPARDLPKVLCAADLEGVEEQSQYAPCIHLIGPIEQLPVGKGDTAQRYRAQKVLQGWLLVVVVKNVKGVAAARSDAGPIISRAIQAIQGWGPSQEHGPMLRRDAPYRPTYRNGFFYFPLFYQTQIITTGDPQ